MYIWIAITTARTSTQECVHGLLVAHGFTCTLPRTYSSWLN
jgi:hypothetical protein